MVIDIFKEIGKNTGFSDRRFIIGLFFPSLMSMIGIFILSFKKFPDDFVSFASLLIISLSFSLTIYELLPRLIYNLSFSKQSYNDHLNKNFNELFIIPVDSYLEENQINKDLYKQKFEEELKNYVENSKSDYFNNFFIPKHRFHNDILILSETRFIFSLTLLFWSSIILFLVGIFSSEPTNFLIFKRSGLGPELSLFLISTFFIILIISMISIIYQSKYIGLNIFKSTNTPSRESSRELNIRTESLKAIESFLNDSNLESDSLKATIYSKALENLSFNALTYELTARIKKNTLEQNFNTFFENHKEELKISSLQAAELSKKLSETTKIYRQYKIGISDKNSFSLVYKRMKERNLNLIKEIDFSDHIGSIDLIVSVNEMVEITLGFITGENTYLDQMKVMNLNEQIFGDGLISDLHKIKQFRRLRNNLGHLNDLSTFPEDLNVKRMINDVILILDNFYKTVINEDLKIQKEKERIDISPNNFVSFGNISILLFVILGIILVIFLISLMNYIFNELNSIIYLPFLGTVNQATFIMLILIMFLLGIMSGKINN